MVGFLTHCLHKGVLVKQALERHQCVLDLRGRANVVKLASDGDHVLRKVDGDVLLLFINDFEHGEGKHLLEVALADAGADLGAEGEVDATVTDGLGPSQIFIKKVMYGLSRLMVWNICEHEHQYLKNMHLDILVAGLKVLYHIGNIIQPYILPGNHQYALIKKVKTSIKTAPFLMRFLKHFENKLCQLRIEKCRR